MIFSIFLDSFAVLYLAHESTSWNEAHLLEKTSVSAKKQVALRVEVYA